MADRSAERLQPSLLDRLTDDRPTERAEGRDDRVIDLRRLREIVQRDLSWLLNTTDNSRDVDPARYPHAARSVLNYGIRSVAGDFSGSARSNAIRNAIQRAIESFEPRINPGSLDVRLSGSMDTSQPVVGFDIVADMWAQPMPVELYLRSEIDLTNGRLKLERKV